jgi:crotonyl-CoA carboxylase/reductase
VGQELYDVGAPPPVGEVPRRMHAQLVRPDRFGEPSEAIRDEVVDVPELGPDDALVMVMAAGVNFNNVWAARGVPVDVTKTQARWGEPTDFHVVGSDASGIVYAVGDRVTNVAVGDHVVVHAGQWDLDDPWVVQGNDPGLAPSFRVWGYDSCWGSFSQFCKVQAHQCLPKAEQLTWEEAAAPTLTGSTAYRMLHGWPPNTVGPGDVVLVWGGAGGLGSLAIQLVTLAGGRAVAVVSSEEKATYCRELGAVGAIDRTAFSHWGVPPRWDDPAWRDWFGGAKAFGKAIWDVLGERTNPRIVFEHPGQDTIPTSIFVCERGGMVVICAGTTGYDTMVDVRYLWYQQKRYQGSHLFNDEQAAAFNDLVRAGRVRTTLGHTFEYDQTGRAHQLMAEGRLPEGNVAVLINAPRRGLTGPPEGSAGS